MSRQFCRLVLCGLACLTADLSTVAFGADHETVWTVSASPPVVTRLAQASQFSTPIPDEAYLEGGMLADPGAPGLAVGGRLEIVPRGTLGQTYTRVSHPVPLDKHPRTAMLAVKDDGTVPFMTVGIMGGVKMKNGIWLFESTRPLDPGACQIVRVEARQTPQDIEPYDTRFVRLIAGRIVYLEF